MVAVGQKLHAADLGCALARIFNNGTGLVTIGAGATGVCAFNQGGNSGGNDISISGTNNTRMTFLVAGEYRYGFCLRMQQAGSAGSLNSDFVAFVRLNGTLRLAARIQKASTASGQVYTLSVTDTRAFAVNDFIEVAVTNSLSVSVAQTATGEETHFYAKRTVGP